MKLKIKVNYRYGSDSNVLKMGYRIAQNMKANAYFPDAKPTAAEVETACNDFNQALSLAGRNDRTLLSVKNDKKAALVNLLDQLNEHVTEVSKGNKTMLLSSGFDIGGIKIDVRELPPITVFTVDVGSPGQATTRVKRVPGARSYVHQYTSDPMTADSVWVSETSTEREHTFNGLQSVTRYWFRVIAIGKGRQSVYSPPVARVIQ
jgi:hypothetical protein